MSYENHHRLLLLLLEDSIHGNNGTLLTENLTNEGLDRNGWHKLYSDSTTQGVIAMLFKAVNREKRASQLELNFGEENRDESTDSVESADSVKIKYGLVDTRTTTPPYDMLCKWESDYLHYAKIYEKQKEILSEIVTYLKGLGCEPILLNGVNYGRYYMNPAARYYGDIDLFLGNDFDNAIKALNNLGLNVKKINRFMARATLRGVCIRVHKRLMFSQFINRLYSKSDYTASKILGEMLTEERREIEVNTVTVTIPSLEFEALYMIKYCMHHFLEYGLYMRHLCDITLFFETNRDLLDHKQLENKLKRLKLYRVYCTFIASCVANLGMDHPGYNGTIKKYSQKLTMDIFFNRYRLTSREKIRTMTGLGRYLLKIRYFNDSRWKYSLIDRKIYYRLLVYKLLF